MRRILRKVAADFFPIFGEHSLTFAHLNIVRRSRPSTFTGDPQGHHLHRSYRSCDVHRRRWAINQAIRNGVCPARRSCAPGPAVRVAGNRTVPVCGIRRFRPLCSGDNWPSAMRVLPTRCHQQDTGFFVACGQVRSRSPDLGWSLRWCSAWLKTRREGFERLPARLKKWLVDSGQR
jgi:hypothetical protein